MAIPGRPLSSHIRLIRVTPRPIMPTIQARMRRPGNTRTIVIVGGMTGTIGGYNRKKRKNGRATKGGAVIAGAVVAQAGTKADHKERASNREETSAVIRQR